MLALAWLLPLPPLKTNKGGSQKATRAISQQARSFASHLRSTASLPRGHSLLTPAAPPNPNPARPTSTGRCRLARACRRRRRRHWVARSRRSEWSRPPERRHRSSLAVQCG
ncbi:hypothetical protein PVAP13_4KG376600 [Panicum virgatum]|uniref:Uncharacterized protein n=1 Tax=Panicum virgatum TaxID=38727 RepID=A0A8T0TW44_PANVG|nr:hypothetical protein PVAP13_4KG376600 [Panicum virgatum]